MTVKPLLPWIAAAVVCALAIAARQFLIQPPEIAHACTSPTLTLLAEGPWWCSVRAAMIMTYAWNGLLVAAILLSVFAALTRRAWLGWLALTVGLVAIVWYTYEPGAVAIVIGALVLARAQTASTATRPSPASHPRSPTWPPRTPGTPPPTHPR